MKIMTINTLSRSMEFTLFEMDDNSVIAKGIIERIGLEDSSCEIKYNGEKIVLTAEINNYENAVKILFDNLLTLNIISSLDDVKAIGHRVVHGGSKYTNSVFISDKVINDVYELSDLAPLYNKSEAEGMKAFKSLLPNTLMVAVFDTAFHQTISEENFLYPIPYEWYEQYGVRKYGFYGTSHKYVTEEIRKILGRDNFKLISCHLGNGGSVSAIKDMKVVDTSTGFTPLSGIVMGTRSGDIDPSIIPFVMEKEGKNVGEIIDDLTKHSGLLGISEYSHDMRDILEQCDKGNEKAILAKNKFVRRVVDFISQYYVLLGGVDAIVFTAGIGENSVPIRREICERLACLGVKIDLDMNNKKCEEVKISTNDSSIAIYTIPTDEELMVAKDTLELITNR